MNCFFKRNDVIECTELFHFLGVSSKNTLPLFRGKKKKLLHLDLKMTTRLFKA